LEISATNEGGRILIREIPPKGVRNGWVAFAVLAMLVALLGGSSRPDAVQIAALRPLSALMLIPALYVISRERIADVKTPLILLVLLLILMAVQLIPLPPALWQSLPGREPITGMAEAIGSAPVWRPISMVPTRTINALASLVVPVSALLLAATMGLRRTTLLLAVAGLGIADALLALLQALSSWNESLYFYAVTNKGSEVGLFANQNHSAVFGALALLVIGHLLSDVRSRNWVRWQRVALFGGFMLVLLSSLIGGSRAGILATGMAVVVSAAMFWISLDWRKQGDGDLPEIFGITLRPSVVFGFGALLVIAIVASFAFFDRIPAIRALTDAGNFDDLRWRLLPSLQQMIATHWAFGAGFGSFEEVYHIYEPSELLAPIYVNQAHNDWAQLIIEGGLLAVALVGLTAFWFIRCLLRIGGTTRQRLAALMFWGAVPAMVLFASLVDYPLRTPLFQFAVTVLVVAFCREVLVERAGYDDNEE